jgi:uncharacterized ferritin-like protein (DUF455 family)
MRSSEILYHYGYSPFRTTSGKPDLIRPLSAPEGVADRLRVVAFAELQARDLFRYGCERFKGLAPSHWLAEWERFSIVEDRHAQMLLTRMAEIGVEAGARSVSDKLSRLCRNTDDPVLFLFLLSSAEERGMESGMVLAEQMQKFDAVSSAIFAQIASEEVEHVESARAALAGYVVPELRERARVLSAGLQAATL